MGQRGISVIIITKNEEINIGRCIQSVQQVADEVIVIDTFSTDKTTKIATELGAQVVSKEWLGYGPQKNFGNNLAQYEYILALDADEALDETLSSEILKLKTQNLLNGVYQLNRMTNYCGKFIKHSGWYPDRKIRLFPKKEAHWDDSPVHEKLIPHKGQGISQIPGHLIHYSFYSISEHWERINKYSDIEAKIIRKKGNKNIWLKLLFSPMFKFFKIYFIKKGFLDGKEGLFIAKFSAYGVFLKYAKALKSSAN